MRIIEPFTFTFRFSKVSFRFSKVSFRFSKVSFTFQILSNINIPSFIQILQSFNVVQQISEQMRKVTAGIIEIENPNLVKAKNVKAKDVDMERKTEPSRREREELEKQKAHERYMRLQEQGKTEQAKKRFRKRQMQQVLTILRSCSAAIYFTEETQL
ncbi:unnamed protein product [Lupinus luteus]|uniref:Casein kinase substrate phosphoprotein PP28 domain-containing protein n=1 Tax=Lupinus luteus TaxID=3873 RepID=A0AAV1WJU6_LUPLU